MTMTPVVGTELVNPKTGTRTVFTATAEPTGGAYVEVEATYPPHGNRPPLHLHPSQVEDFTVLSGQVDVVRGDETFTVKEGDAFTVPAGTPHQMWSSGDDGAVMRWRTTPALRTGEMFCSLWEAARDADWSPDPLRLLEVLGDHTAEFCLC
jgi:mannose-6-phosphate isomerase-like protein (cupin superfamily)